MRRQTPPGSPSSYVRPATTHKRKNAKHIRKYLLDGAIFTLWLHGPWRMELGVAVSAANYGQTVGRAEKRKTNKQENVQNETHTQTPTIIIASVERTAN